MCCDPTDYKEDEIDWICFECKAETVDWCAFEACGYSPVECDICWYAPCDQSC